MTHDDIRHEAFKIHQDKLRLGLPDANDSEKNWQEAITRLREFEVRDTWGRGGVGR